MRLSPVQEKSMRKEAQLHRDPTACLPACLSLPLPKLASDTRRELYKWHKLIYCAGCIISASN